jgi:CheY-like chemotaxis protein
VLFADADADTHALYERAFKLAGFESVHATDGRDALTKALVYPPSLVVMELRLPRIDAFALCEILRVDRATARVPILIVTGEARTAELQRILDVGADEVLVKPVSPDVLVAQARQLIAESASSMGGWSTRQGPRSLESRRPTDTAAGAHGQTRRIPLIKTHKRGVTSAPPLAPPALTCPNCDRPLTYEFSHIGGVSDRHPEQWGYFSCTPCGPFQYRHRTRKLRLLSPDDEVWVHHVRRSGS